MAGLRDLSSPSENVVIISICITITIIMIVIFTMFIHYKEVRIGSEGFGYRAFHGRMHARVGRRIMCSHGFGFRVCEHDNAQHDHAAAFLVEAGRTSRFGISGHHVVADGKNPTCFRPMHADVVCVHLGILLNHKASSPCTVAAPGAPRVEEDKPNKHTEA